jgi:methylaspartate ammonia-lyase
MAEAQAEDEPYAVEIAVNQAIAACEGDLRATIRALIIANDLLEEELAEIIDLYCSSGFHRGKLRVRDLP